MGQNVQDLSPETVLVQSDSVLFSEVGDGTVLMDMEDGDYFHYETVGSRIWELIDGERDIAAICAQLIEEYDVDQATCERQTSAFLSQLLTHRHVRQS